MQYLTEDDVKAFYAEVIGPPAVRYPGGLASAVGRPQQSAFGEDAYPTISLKAAALMQSLAENQPFVDGNKRIAWICGKLFLQLHGVTMHATDEEGRELFLRSRGERNDRRRARRVDRSTPLGVHNCAVS